MKVIAIVFLVIFLTATIIRWQSIVRLYRKSLWRAIGLTIRAGLRSVGRKFLLGAILAMLLAMFHPAASDPYARLFMTIISLTLLSIFTEPPTALILASSRSPNASVVASWLGKALFGGLVFYFLRPGREEVADTSSYYFGTDAITQEGLSNRRTLDDMAWSTIVYPLMELVPIIVVEASVVDGPLELEIQRLTERPSLQKKVIVVAPEAGKCSSVVARIPYNLAGTTSLLNMQQAARSMRETALHHTGRESS